VGQLKGCLLVYQNRDLVVASARGTLEPLLQLATKQIDQATTHFLLR
jgi:hypothetical protein